MKKLIAMTVIALAVTSTSVNVAAEESKAVWIDAGEVTLDQNTLEVTVQSDGEVTDGVLALKYDTNVLSIEESDVKLDDQVAMYAVNVEDGTVKISYLAEDALEEGTFITLDFKAKDGTGLDDAKKALTGLTGTNYKEDGTTVAEERVGIVAASKGGETPSTEKPGKDDSLADKDSQTGTDTDKNNQEAAGTVKTNDTNNMAAPILLGCAGAALCGAAVYAKSRRKEEK